MKYLHNLVLHYYKGRDSSHNYTHVFNVYNMAKKIAKREKIKDKNELLIIKYASLFHDAWDNKYIKSKRKRNKIKEELREDLKKINLNDIKIDNIYEIIDNISYTKEKNIRKDGKKLDLNKLSKLRNIVSDADKIESLGKTGIERITVYEKTKKKNKSVKYYIERVKELYNNRIIDIIENDYIKTISGKDIAKKSMLEMSNVMNDENELYEVVSNFL